jgi:hypothetical protein
VLSEKWNPKIFFNLSIILLTYQGALVKSNDIYTAAFQLPGMAASNGPPDGMSIAHHGTHELHVQQHNFSDGQATSPIKVVMQATSLSHFS